MDVEDIHTVGNPHINTSLDEDFSCAIFSSFYNLSLGRVPNVQELK
jgi:hypothetical protein